MKVRQDAWTDEDDLLLAETLLRHIREGSTQLNAFEEVGDVLNRTSAACGFRWNAVVRHSFESDLKISRKFWKDTQRAIHGKTSKKKPLYEPSTPLIEFQEVPAYRTLDVETGEIIEPDVEIETSSPRPIPQPTGKSVTINDVVSFVQSLHLRHQSGNILQQENAYLKQENERIKHKNTELAERINQLESDSNNIQEDYETIMKIMNRARKMVLFDDEEQVSSTFKMDRNGNLERMAE